MRARTTMANRLRRLSIPSRFYLAALAYAVLAAASLVVAPGPLGSATFWPVSGLFVAALLLAPRARRLAVTVAFGLAHYIGGLAGTTPQFAHLAFSVVVTFEAWLAVTLIEAIDSRPLRFNRLADVGRLFIGGCVLASGVGGAIGGAVANAIFQDPFFVAWREWWLPDAVGILLATPLVMRMAEGAAWERVTARRAVETLVLFAGLFVVAWYIFRSDRPAVPLLVGVLPFLVWAALRFGVAGISAASLLLWGVAVLAVGAGSGPFMSLGSTDAARLAWSHVYVAITCGSVLVISAIMAERQEVSARLTTSMLELRDANARVQALIASAPDMLAAVDAEFRIVAFNPAWAVEFEHVTGHAPSIGLNLGDALRSSGTPWALAALGEWVRAIAGERLSTQRGPEMTGMPRELRAEFSPIRDNAGRDIGAVQILRDVTDERRRQQAEAQASRFESVGQLAGGIAHSFNNLLTGILSYSYLLEESLDVDDERRRDIAEITHAGRRAAELISQLLAYARRQEVAPQVIEPNAVLRGAELLLRRLLGVEWEIALDLVPDAWQVRFDPAQLERILVNLAINARDAMPEGGRLNFSSNNVTMQAADLPQPASGAGDYVRIDVSDAGHGIPPELFENIFEPFFTTKEVGKGTGLGLASMFGILQQSGGAVGFTSVVGSGTTFSIYLPRAAQQSTQLQQL